MTYSLDFRKRVLSVQDQERLTFKETSKRFLIGLATLVRWHNRLVPKMTRNKPAVKINMEALKEDVLKHPDSYLHERAKRFQVSISGIQSALKRLGISYKKKSVSSESHTRK